ncbi:iron uptake transporter deferrochelatase/peroxidase subunit [Mumia zhuanghuii]|uniref:Deferrochelatase n=1 Tax=Mumia zhuanghuii TaxID=2585211 RepID=A0A5C4MF21_9ACTN|nr:iron uptake transporter deferrochelatase/peroxidase subunit [Mumia zhuanghuii]TNC36441.1 deferrochelatase/peroxidase EfeB [Mumia zhuanghuii]TNC42406.1 deferrochelatase/peroxidase EfeB [Mumia zhuanghuii]
MCEDAMGEERRGISRRGLIGGGAALGVGAAAAGFGAGRAVAGDESTSRGDAQAYELYGVHQPGIVTPVQDRLHFASFDVTTDSRAALVGLLREWTDAAARMMHGAGAGPAGPTSGDYDAPPDDTGEAIGLPPSRLTLTFGFGASLFDDRFGLSGKRPAALEPLPHFPGDNLSPERSHGDLCVQACADDPQVAVHAIRNLARIGFGTVALRWSQLGFGKTSTTTRDEATPRNLFGFKDGTMNVKSADREALGEHVWVGKDSDQPWMTDGSYLVARRISMTIEIWDRQPMREQERVVGRTKAEGAPLSGGAEHDQPDFARTGREDAPLVDPAAHVAIAHPDHNDGVRMLRRGYNFVDGSNDLGRMDAGLFFLAYVVDPRTHFTPVQMRLSTLDAMQEYVQHTGSGLFAIPPGVRKGEYVGQGLFSA